LSGIIVRPHKDLCSLVYPVTGLGAAKQLKHIHKDERPKVQLWIQQENNLEDFGMSSVECVLCETPDWRIGKIFDYFIRGMSLFYLNKEGVSMVKTYGTYHWEKVPVVTDTPGIVGE